MYELLLGNSATVGCVDFVCCRFSPPAARGILLEYIPVQKITSAFFQESDRAYSLSSPQFVQRFGLSRVFCYGLCCAKRTGPPLRSGVPSRCLPRPRGRKAFRLLPQGRSGRGLPGVAMECNKKKASGSRQVESLLDVFLSRGIPDSTGMMIFKYCARMKIL